MSCRKLSKIMRLRLRTSRWVIIGLKCNIMQHYYIEHILIRGCDFSACPHIACQDEAIPGQWCSAKWQARGETLEGARVWCQVPSHGVADVMAFPMGTGSTIFFNISYHCQVPSHGVVDVMAFSVGAVLPLIYFQTLKKWQVPSHTHTFHRRIALKMRELTLERLGPSKRELRDRW